MVTVTVSEGCSAKSQAKGGARQLRHMEMCLLTASGDLSQEAGLTARPSLEAETRGCGAGLLAEGTVGQFRSIAQLCPTPCDPMNRSTPGLPVHHQLLELTQTHVHQVGDAIQPSHPLSSPSPPAPNPSQHQSFFNESTLRMRWPKY